MIWSWLLSIILSVIYVLVIVPLGFIRQCTLNTKARYGFDPKAKSYWIKRTPATKAIDMTRQS